MESQIQNIILKQRNFFATGETKKISYRIENLKKLKKEILENELNIKEALKKDLNKSYSEAYMTEIGMTLSELNYVIKHTKKWAKKKIVPTPIAHFPSV